jgi:yersiniabactin nonribosomal peptide synthetase
VMEQDGELRFNWDAAEELFPGILDDMFAAFTRLLEWLADPGTDWAGALPAMLPDTQRAVREEVNRPRAPLPDRGLHEAFFAQAQARGDAPAVLWGTGGRLSHADLRRRALELAGLLRAHGVAGGEPVLVTLAPGPEQIIAVLGVLAAGASYVPVGVEQPPARRARIAAGAGARLAVCADGTELPDTVAAVTLGQAAGHAPLPAPVPVDPDALAYVIYTSGSTGEPKGVMVSHRAALNTIDAINDRWDVGPEDRVLAVSALDFDLSVYDIFGLLGAGGALVTPDPDQRLEPRHWHELLRRHRVTVWNTVPALLDMLLVLAAGDGLPAHLRLALLSGDWIGLDLPPRLHALVPGCRFVAMGGATEAGIWSNAIEVGDPLRAAAAQPGAARRRRARPRLPRLGRR